MKNGTLAARVAAPLSSPAVLVVEAKDVPTERHRERLAPLVEEEWTLVRRHPEIGERICAPLESFAAFGAIIRGHDQRWDGTGYPDGLRGERPADLAQPLGARAG